VNLRFAAADEAPAVENYKTTLLGLGKDDFFRIGETLVLAVIAILVMLLVVRPLLGRLLTIAQTGVAAGAETRLLTDQSGGATAALPPPAGAAGVPAEFTPSGTAQTLEAVEQMIDLNRVEGRVRASSIKKIGEIVDKHPEEAVAILRSWMYQSS
jgi:flagellar M-ring protein FliF